MMTKIYHHAFYPELRFPAEEAPVLLTDTSLSTPQDKERMLITMFDHFEVPALTIQNHSVLSLYSLGKTTGLVIDSGKDLTFAEPIFEGYRICNTTKVNFMGGNDLDNKMAELMKEVGWDSEGSARREMAREFKERFGFVSLDYESDLKRSKDGEFDKIYELPEGGCITISSERFRCPEIMFQPQLINSLSLPIHSLATSSVLECDLDVQPTLFNNILLSGGNSLFPNFKDRFWTEISKISPFDIKFGSVKASEDKYSAFKGGSILASLSKFEGMWISRKEYQEYGETIVHRKCF